MAIYRNVHITFWSDTKVTDDFTPEDKYFYLYLLTNPHTNLCGCYEISLKQMSDELGYNKESVIKLISRFHNVHRIIEYNERTKEMLIYNWNKYNWTKSPKLEKAVAKEIEKVKNNEFKIFLEGRLYGTDTVSISYTYPMDTTVPATVPATDTVTDIYGREQTPQNTPIVIIPLRTGEDYPIYQSDIEKWQSIYPDIDVIQQLRKMSGWSYASPGKRKTKNDILPFINKWLAEEQEKISDNPPTQPQNINPNRKNQFNNFQQNDYDYAALEKALTS